MATIAERLALLVTADVNQAVRGLGELETAAKRTSDEASTRLDKVGSTLTRVGAASMAGGLLVGAGLVVAADSTRRLQDQTTRAEASFGDAFATMQKEAKNAINTLGISERAFLEASSSVAVYGRQAGLSGDDLAAFSTEVVTVTRDLASFVGLGFDEGIQAVGAAFRGEYDPLERFGIALSETKIQAEAAERGLGKLEKGSAEYVNLVRTLIIEQSQMIGAYGDYQRTADSATNTQQRFTASMENFQATIGQTVLPIITELLGGATNLINKFNELDESQKAAVSTFATVGAGVAVVGGAFTLTVGQLIKMRAALQGIASAAPLAAAALGTVGIGATTAAAAYAAWRFSQQDDEERVRGLTAAMQQQGSAFEGARQWLETYRKANDDAAKVMDAAGISTRDLAAAVVGTDADWQRYTSSVYENLKATGAAPGMYLELQIAFKNLREEAREAQREVFGLGASLGAGVAAGFNTARSMGAAAAASRDLGDAAGYAAGALGGLLSLLGMTYDSTLGTASAQLDLAIQIDEVNRGFQSVGGGGGSAQKTAEALDNVEQKARDVTRAQRDLVRAQESLTEAQENFNEVTSSGVGSEEYKDINDELNELFLSRKEASLALQRAQERLVDVEEDNESSALDLEEAELAVERAKMRLRSIIDQQRDAQDRLTRVVQGAKEGSDEYEDAQRRLEDAQWAVEEATIRLADAQRDQLTPATEGAGGAAGGAATSFGDMARKSLDAAQNIIELTQKMLGFDENTRITKGNLDLLIGSLRAQGDQLDPSSPTRRNLDEYIRQLERLRDLNFGPFIENLREISRINEGGEFPAIPFSSSSTVGGKDLSLQSVGGGGTATIVVPVSIDGRVVAEAVADAGRYSGGTIR